MLIPDGWQSDANSLVAGPMKVDSFYAADTVDGVQSNISVTCELNPTGVSGADFLKNRLETVSKLSPMDLTDPSPITVGGVQAGTRYSYTLTRSDIVLRKTDVMFVAGACAWTVSAVTAPSQETQTSGIFNAFLGSFQLIGSSAGTSS